MLYDHLRLFTSSCDLTAKIAVEAGARVDNFDELFNSTIQRIDCDNLSKLQEFEGELKEKAVQMLPEDCHYSIDKLDRIDQSSFKFCASTKDLSVASVDDWLLE